MPVEIPPEAAAAFEAVFYADEPQDAIRPLDAALAAAAPHLFAAWSERLTSDEAERILHEELIARGERGLSCEALKLALKATVAALSSVSGKDGADA